jgi:uncharacterized membrane protein
MNMNPHKILKGLVAVVMATVLVVLAMLTIKHVQTGIMTQNQKLMLGAYVLMMLYAAYRLFVNIRDIFRS